jgi:chitinase
MQLLVLLSALSLSVQDSPKFITYVDYQGINYNPIGADVLDPYNVVIIGFFQPHAAAVYNPPRDPLTTDFAYNLFNVDASKGRDWVEKMHSKGKKVILAYGGAAEGPASVPGYYEKYTAADTAKAMAKVVTDNGLDGVELDWEDGAADIKSGLLPTGLCGPVGNQTCGEGPAVQWLIDLTKNLRGLLPREKGFTISHTPVAPYFNLGYAKIAKAVAAEIDFFTVQFYNQGEGRYTTYDGLINKETFPDNPSAWPTWDGSLKNILQVTGLPASKIIVGKYVTASKDGNNGHVEPDVLGGWLQKAGGEGMSVGGVMAWQFGSDTDGKWMGKVQKAWGPGPPGPAPSPASPTPANPTPAPPTPAKPTPTPAPPAPTPAPPAPTPAPPAPTPAGDAKYLCDWETYKCKASFAGGDMASCEKRCFDPHKPTPGTPTPSPPAPTPSPPAPTPASSKSYRCLERGGRYGCLEDPEGAFKSHQDCISVANNQSKCLTPTPAPPMGFVCDYDTYTCKQAPHGEPKSSCTSVCYDPSKEGKFCGSTNKGACAGSRGAKCTSDFDCGGADFCFPCTGPAAPTPGPPSPTPGPPSPTPGPPSPTPGPAGDKYLCDTASLTCKVNSAAGQTKSECEAVCKHALAY